MTFKTEETEKLINYIDKNFHEFPKNKKGQIDLSHISAQHFCFLFLSQGNRLHSLCFIVCLKVP